MLRRGLGVQPRHAVQAVQVGALLMLGPRRRREAPVLELAARPLVDERSAQERRLVRRVGEDRGQELGVPRRSRVYSRRAAAAGGRIPTPIAVAVAVAMRRCCCVIEQ